jgi:hypothetical protein
MDKNNRHNSTFEKYILVYKIYYFAIYFKRCFEMKKENEKY